MSEYKYNPIDSEETPFLTPEDMMRFMDSYGLEGNIICPTWYKTIKWKRGKRSPNGKPHLEAINLLSDIVYWYRPSQHEDSKGNVTISKKFQADILQRSYEDIEDKLGITKQEAVSAFQTLEALGIAAREFRTVISKGVKVTNILYIRFFPQNLKRLRDNYLQEQEEENGILKKLEGCPVQTGGVSRSNGKGVSFQRETNTKTTTKTTTKNKHIAQTENECPPSDKKATTREDRSSQHRVDFQFSSSSGKFEGIAQEDRDAWKIAYPNTDLNKEIIKAEQWLLSNPSKAKKKNWRRFLTSWLQRVDDQLENKKAFRSMNNQSSRKDPKQDENYDAESEARFYARWESE